MENLTILLIFSLGAILLIACFVGGILFDFVFSVLKNLIGKLFGKKND